MKINFQLQKTVSHHFSTEPLGLKKQKLSTVDSGCVTCIVVSLLCTSHWIPRGACNTARIAEVAAVRLIHCNVWPAATLTDCGALVEMERLRMPHGGRDGGHSSCKPPSYSFTPLYLIFPLPLFKYILLFCFKGIRLLLSCRILNNSCQNV